MKKQAIKIIKILLAILVLYFVLAWTSSLISLDKLENFAQSLGVFGPLIIVLYIIFSHVLAPLVGTPAIVLGVLMFGVFETVFYLYLANMISAIINFYISRKFGRKLVLRFVGKRSMAKIDEFINLFGTKLLIVSRVLGFSVSELISYAAGLTKISFKKYFVITLIFTLMPCIVFGFLFKDIDITSKFNIFLWFGAIILTGIVFTIYVKMFLRKRG
ncbi:hypothetical protein CL633_02735 [bacterium]|nr:hypothetical protein [bacterium]|tara:strand:+ start:1411 stop:2058 length:648 start_codon:yes stop_codon:yes gene_type:complete